MKISRKSCTGVVGSRSKTQPALSVTRLGGRQVMVCTELAVFPAPSVAVHVRVTTFGQTPLTRSL